MEEGAPYRQVVKEAMGLGVLEADPSLDLEGVDPAAKLSIIALTLGLDVPLEAVERESLADRADSYIEKARIKGLKVRYVARLSLLGGLKCEVRLNALQPDNPLARIRGVDNAVIIRTFENNILVKGKGGGGRVTAEGVLEDILSILDRRG